MQSHLPWKELGYAVGGLGLLLFLYVVAYSMLVSPETEEATRRVVTSVPCEVTESTDNGVVKRIVTQEVLVIETFRRVVATYAFEESFGKDAVRSLFAPINDLDRRLRVDRWKESVLPATPWDPCLPEPLEVESTPLPAAEASDDAK